MRAVLRVLLVLLCTWMAPTRAQDLVAPALPEVSLVTVEPGELYWQRFGHNAILLRDPMGGRSISYNFGYFDFEQEDFLLRFLRGKMLYQAVALDGEADIAGYLADGRRVWVQRLNLPPEGVAKLAAHLELHVLPEHRDYRYDYYTINCSTKVRDALDLALDGALERATSHRSRGWSWRRYTRALARDVWWMYLGTDLLLGQPVDRPLSLWEEAFIPAELMRHVEGLQLADGQKLVASTEVLPAGASAEPQALVAPDWRTGFTAAGLGLAGVLVLLARLAERGGMARWPLALVGGSLALLLGACGWLIAGLWLGTDHAAAWRNQNLLLVSPLWWLSLPAWWLLARRERISGLAARLAVFSGWAALAGIALGAFLKVFRSFDQVNIEWLLLLGPAVFALRHVLVRRCDGVAGAR